MEEWKNVFGHDYKLSLCLVQLTFIVTCPSKGKEFTTPVVLIFVSRVAVFFGPLSFILHGTRKNACFVVFLIINCTIIVKLLIYVDGLMNSHRTKTFFKSAHKLC
jgi:hypothetical protein